MTNVGSIGIVDDLIVLYGTEIFKQKLIVGVSRIRI